MNFKSIYIAILSAIIIVLITIGQAYSKKEGSPAARTGSPGDGLSNTCAISGCHSGAINSFPGSISIDVSDIPAQGYVSGETYSIVVTVAEAGRGSFGFQLTAEDIAENKMGTYSVSGGVKVVSGSWVTHSIPNSTGVWTFDWTAPTGNQTVTFYAAGNAANGNNSASGDHIYTSSVSVLKDILSSVDEFGTAETLTILSIQNKILQIRSLKPLTLRMINLRGNIVKTITLESGYSEISMFDIPSGLYIVSDSTGNICSKIIIGQ